LANTHIKLWAGRNTHERFLDQTSQKRRFNNLTVFFLSVVSLSTRFNISFEANDETKDAKQQEKLAASVLKPTLS
jgi:hypothetical protein